MEYFKSEIQAEIDEIDTHLVRLISKRKKMETEQFSRTKAGQTEQLSYTPDHADLGRRIAILQGRRNSLGIKLQNAIA